MYVKETSKQIKKSGRKVRILINNNDDNNNNDSNN